ncbi:MAG: hypothetical protein R3C03_07395 [Pirellulaceae bacterium]
MRTLDQRTIWQLILFSSLLAMGYLYWPTGAERDRSSVDSRELTKVSYSPATSGPQYRSIRDIRVGMRVLAHNPEVSELDRMGLSTRTSRLGVTCVWSCPSRRVVFWRSK